MKRSLLIASLLVISFSSARAQSPEALQLFDQGAAHLLEGRFQDALQAFEQVEASGWQSAGLYYNMGLAHYRMDALGQSIRFLERASALNDEDPRIQHSLGIARARQVDSFSTLPDPFWRTTHQFTARVIPVGPAFLLGALLWLGFFGLLIHASMMGDQGDWHRRARQVCGIAGGLLLVHALGTSAFPPYDERAVILEQAVQLREQADPDAESVMQIHEGLVVETGPTAQGWVRVQIPNGTRGWVPAESIGTI